MAVHAIRVFLVPSLMLVACATEPVDSPAVEPPDAIAPAFALLDSALSSAQRDSLRISTQDVGVYHFGLGMWLRNNAGLWHGSAVAESLRARGVEHPEDMSHVMLGAYVLHLQQRPVLLDSLISALRPAPSGFKELPRPAVKP